MSQALSEYLKQCLTDDRLQRFNDVVKFRTRHLTVVLENVYHEHNASAVLRTCDCLGIQDVHVIESLNSFAPNPEVALGASKWLTVHNYRSEPDSSDRPPSNISVDCIRHLKENGFRVLSTSPRQDSLPLSQVPFDQKTAIVFGAEQIGVSDEAISESDDLIHIPMFGFTESFNVSVSAAVILQHLATLLHASDIDWQLTDTEHGELTERWVRQSLGSKLEPLIRRFNDEQISR
ncbi:MAG: RNA methyltransferase [Fuerstiella sp.]|nr:RNA methyltransferase [Fuerstiella sp.]